MISELCTSDLAGNVTVVLRHAGHIEAPNWHAKGALIVNGGGRLYNVPLAAPRLDPIDTGFATGLNNDHGISPCGTRLAISDKTETGQSCIYTLPISGGRPERVTPKVPSWWHSWSPDGERIAYAAARDGGPVAVYTCQLDGTDEICVSPGFDHADGPDYAPGGQWIWFNGERAARVDLWRVRPDGSGLERMTHGKDVDWFPHPSPDGDHVLWLAYPPGTQGHPGNLTVTLRMMSADGGPARDVVRLFGGQGTLNVPCWSPDGRQFAFVRYETEP